MKVEDQGKSNVGRRPQAREPFKHVLRKSTTPARAMGSPPLGVGGATAEKLTSVRSVMHVEANRLVVDRRDAQTTQGERISTRLTELIGSELQRELRTESAGPSRETTGLTFTSPETARLSASPPDAGSIPSRGGMSPMEASDNSGAARAEAALELIEKIEYFVRSGRPAMSLTLHGRLSAEVEIERVGPKEIAVRLKRVGVPMSVEELRRIREEIARRGLKVSSLSVG